jgi:hypothetical protein
MIGQTCIAPDYIVLIGDVSEKDLVLEMKKGIVNVRQ